MAFETELMGLNAICGEDERFVLAAEGRNVVIVKERGLFHEKRGSTVAIASADPDVIKNWLVAETMKRNTN